MENLDIEALINKSVIEKIVKKESDKNSFQNELDKKTNLYLKIYPEIIQSINDRNAEIEEIRNNVSVRSRSVSMYSYNLYNTESEYERIQRKIEELEKKNEISYKIIWELDFILKRLKSDVYYCVIEMFYFKNMKISRISSCMNIPENVIKENKDRLFKKIQFYLFSDEIIESLFG